MKYKGVEYDTYPKVIDHALKLKGREQQRFVRAYLRIGPYTRTNIGYFAGYYDKAKRAKIHRVFGAEHPVFGRFV